MNDSPLLHVETTDHVLLVVPTYKFGVHRDLDLAATWKALEKSLEETGSRDVLVDLAGVPYFGSTMLEWMVHLWKHTKRQHRKLVLCNVSSIASEVLVATRFSQIWPHYGSREEALEVLAMQNAQQTLEQGRDAILVASGDTTTATDQQSIT